MTYSMKELMDWDRPIEELARKVGLDFYEQIFEVVNFKDMIEFEAYTGMPSRYPHWSFGKAYERTATLYKYGVQGLPYEMVINSNPCLAYLMRDNTLLLQILTIAHVYGHNDFFKNNRLFKQGTNADYTIEMFKNNAIKVRSFTKDPSIGYTKVERILDAAHGLRFQKSRTPGSKRLSYEEQEERTLASHNKQQDYEYEFNRPKATTEDSKIVINTPPNPEEDLLFFLGKFADLEEWEIDLIDIVAKETEYFIPQIQTKIMNEGWASFWHYTLLKEVLGISHQDLYWEFIKHHNLVLRPFPGTINPYYLGFKIFEDLEKRFDRKKIFEARELESDQSFLLRYLTEDLCREMNLFEYVPHYENNIRVTEISDKEGWKKIRNSLAFSVGMNAIPSIKVIELIKKDNTIVLQHEFDGRELEFNYAIETLKYFSEIWKKGKVQLCTTLEGREMTITCDEDKKIF